MAMVCYAGAGGGPPNGGSGGNGGRGPSGGSGGNGDEDDDEKPMPKRQGNIWRFFLKKNIIKVLKNKHTRYILCVRRNNDERHFDMEGFFDVAGTTTVDITNLTDVPIFVRIQSMPKVDRDGVSKMDANLSGLNHRDLFRRHLVPFAVLSDEIDPEEKISLSMNFFGNITRKNEFRGETYSLNVYIGQDGDLALDGDLTCNGPPDMTPDDY